MPSWDDVEVGDKVTIERTGTVKTIDTAYVSVDGRIVDKRISTLKCIEKPRAFKPGDVVKPKGVRLDPPPLYTIGDGKFYDHDEGRWYSWTLTPKHYERVL